MTHYIAKRTVWIMKAACPILLLGVAVLGTLPGVVLASSGFAVAPARLDVAVPERGTASAYVYITSHLDGELLIDTEGIPFRVEPESISLSNTDRNREVELLIHADPAVPGGEYTGKLTFLALGDGNLALGIKIDVSITKAGGKGFVERYIAVIGAVLGVLVVVIIGILIWRRGRRRPQPALARKGRREKTHKKSRTAR